MNTLRSSQISTHLGLGGRRRVPSLPAAAREQLSQSAAAATPPVLPSQGPSINGAYEQDRYSLLDHPTAPEDGYMV